MAERTRASGVLESEIIACLTAADEPMTPAEVRAELGDHLAYTTVMTTLARLHAKQALVRTSRGRAYAYQLSDGPAGAKAGMTAHQMQRLLAADDDRAGVLSRFVGGLDDDSATILRELLAEQPADRARPARRRRSGGST